LSNHAWIYTGDKSKNACCFPRVIAEKKYLKANTLFKSIKMTNFEQIIKK